jgi:hypothetical protein
MVERADVRIPSSLKKLKRLGQTRIAEARQAVTEAQRLAENTKAIRGQIELFNGRFLKALRDRKGAPEMYSRNEKDPMSFREVYSSTHQFLGAVYLNYVARKWAIKEYPGQWFETEGLARMWLINRNQAVVRG